MAQFQWRCAVGVLVGIQERRASRVRMMLLTMRSDGSVTTEACAASSNQAFRLSWSFMMIFHHTVAMPASRIAHDAGSMRVHAKIQH